MIKSRQDRHFELFASVVMIIVMAIIIFPFLLLFISSITEENTLLINGYSIFPEKLSLAAYEYIWNSGSVIFRAYATTILVTLVGTICHVTLVALVLFAGTVAVTRYVSLGSILVSLWLPVGVAIYGALGKWGLAQGHLYEMYAIAVFLCAMALFRHRKNIRGLLAGTERKLGEKAE